MKNNTFNLVFCSIISVIVLAFLYLSAVLPTGSVAAFGFSVLTLCIATAECGAKWGLSTALVSGLLAFIFIPDKLILFPYALFFGYYPVLKLYIERIRKLPLEWALKTSSFSIAMLAVYLIMKLQSLIVFDLKLVIIAAIAMEIVFVIYDKALTQLISLYLGKLSPKLRKR